jgi:hypothetical protein
MRVKSAGDLVDERNNMRKLSTFQPMTWPAVLALTLGAMACEQAKTEQAKPAQSEKSPIERLARAAIKSQAVQATKLIAARPPVPRETNEDIAQNKAELQAMAALLSGATTLEPKIAKTEREVAQTPAPQAGPTLPRRRRAPRIVRAEAPVQARPIDHRANKSLASTLTDASFSEVMNGWRGIKACVKSVTSRGLGGSGALKVSFKINSDGSVKESKIANASNPIAQRVGSCITRQARNIQFPAYAGASIVKKEAKFVF